MRRNRNVTLQELRSALARCDGNRSEAARWLGVSFNWVMVLIRKYEDAGEVLPRTPHRKRHRLEPEEPEYEPTPAEIEAAKQELKHRHMEAKKIHG
jgi:transposase